jgi:hypothetical protein
MQNSELLGDGDQIVLGDQTDEALVLDHQHVRRPSATHRLERIERRRPHRYGRRFAIHDRADRNVRAVPFRQPAFDEREKRVGRHQPDEAEPGDPD